MAEECLDRALAHHALKAAPCRTATDRVQSVFSLQPAFMDSSDNTVSNGERERLVANLPYTIAQARHSIRHEMARRVEDILARRTRALFLDARAANAAAPIVARLLADELGHAATWVEHELATFATIAKHYLPEPVRA